MSAAATLVENRPRRADVKGYREQRSHDCLYDPLFTVSGESDHTRACFRSHTSGQRLNRVPNYESMFSSLPHHPSYSLRLEPKDPVPAFIDRRWRGHLDRRRDALLQLARFSPVYPRLRSHPRDNCDVSGADRCKFFKRPLIPFSSQLPAHVLLSLPKASPYSSADRGGDPAQGPFQRSQGVQTDYRDSEAQTDPYSPSYVVKADSVPELLTLATLTWNRGLPAGLAEVELIERTRARRSWEEALPPLNDLSQLDKRRRMMEEMERKEWVYREEEIQKLQDARLDLLMRLLQQREQRKEETTEKQLKTHHTVLQSGLDARISKIRRSYVLSIRKLIAKRKNVEGKLERRDTVTDYCNYGSQVYAPLSRSGLLPDRHSESNVVKSRFLSTYQGLLELEAGLPASALLPSTTAPKPKVAKGYVKRSDRYKMELDKTYQLKEVKVQKESKPLRFLQRMEKPAPRPPTPSVAVPPEGEEDKELAIINLQKLLRGRSIQNMMFEGKMKHLELIQELRSTHALQREEQDLKQADKEATLTMQSLREMHQHKVWMAEGLQAGMAAGVLADMLDFLSKELVRVQEERRIHALALLAERNRRRREAEESGRRQEEERRRREEDEIFRQVVQVHQETVDLYLEDVILGSIEKTADEQAREEIRKMAEEVNDIAYSMEEVRTSLQSQEMVAELVYSFLIPEVQKITMRQRVRENQRRYLQAAHHLIHGEAHTYIGPRSSSPSPQAAAQIAAEALDHSEGTDTGKLPAARDDQQTGSESS
ncbi:cilia- and flagella-associated protein 91 isoform X2 [Brienomyrus brachyistius]|uniref:cilia- and flagella-associated protein 91 isoform X2 n=1 Tax=Brienomyrus brachyistius TaxID=42636 RepID=UPI0020B18185|nr:cilia- and flagella-associated protein 91 isoform X2 [Brienomyrus brachyistius]